MLGIVKQDIKKTEFLVIFYIESQPIR